MAGRSSTRRPWLAALLAVLATGAGHLYLRRWLRALGWLALTAAVTALFVPEAALPSATAGDPVELEPLLPTLTVVWLSVLDAYRIAKLEGSRGSSLDTGDADPSAAASVEGASGVDSVLADGGDDAVDCPHCGRPLDPELDFCHWCTTELGDFDGHPNDQSGNDV